MTVTNVEKKEKSTVELTIQVGAEEFEAALQKAYLKKRGSINVPGFRKGKAPRKIIESMYGAGVFYEDAVNDLYPGAYDQAVKEQGLEDVGYPKMEIVTVGREGFTFKALVSVPPEVRLGEYKGLTAPREEEKVTDKDVDEELKPYIARATRLVAVKRKAKKGDTAVIDFEGFMDGAPFEGGKGDNYSLELGSGTFIPGFEDKVIGMKAGEEKDLELTFPEDYHKELAGKDVVFKVKVNEVKEPVAPELDDEFAKDVSEFETLEELKKDLADKLAKSRAEKARKEFEEEILEQLTGNMEADIPDAMVEVRTDRMIDDYAMRIANQGMRFEEYMKMMGMSMEMLRAAVRPNALKQVQVDLALAAVAREEGMEATGEEIESEVARLAEQYKLQPEQVKAAVAEDDLRRDILMRKASEFVFASAKVGKSRKAKKEEKAAGDEAKDEEKAAKKSARKTAKKAEESEEEGAGKPKRSRKKKSEDAPEAKTEE